MPKTIVYLYGIELFTGKANDIHAMEMCHAFSNIGYRVVLLTPSTIKSDKLNSNKFLNFYGINLNWEIHKIKMPKKLISGRTLLFSLRSMAALKKYSADCQFYTRNPWIYFIVSSIMGLHVAFEAHQYRYRQVIHSLLYQWLIKSASRQRTSMGIVAISNVLKDYWVGKGIFPGNILVAHDGVNIDKYRSVLTKEASRKMLGIHQEQNLIVYTGSLISGKGVESLVEASAFLPDCTVLIVGGENEQIEKLKKMQIKGNVKYVGKVSPNYIPLYQYAADVLCLPNSYGGPIDDVTSPMKLFEYMAACRPIVAGGMPSIKEVLIHNKNALLYSPGDVQALVSHIRTLLHDKNKALELATAAREDVQEYTWIERAKRIKQFIEE